MYSQSGIFSLYRFPLADVRRKFPIVLSPPLEAGVTCSIEPVEAINIRRIISVWFLLEYFTTKALRLLSEVGRKRALFFMSLNISRSFSLGIISSKEFKKVLRLNVS